MFISFTKKWHFSPLFCFLWFSSCRVSNTPYFSNGWMKTWMSGGGQEESEEALKSGIEAIRVSVSMLCEHWWPGAAEGKHWDDKKPVGQTNCWLELVGTALRGAAGRGRGWNHTQAPPLLYSYSPARQLRGSTCKKKIKVHKMDWISVILWLNK